MKEKAMQYTRLGSSGLKISRGAMGTMSFGEGDSSRGGWPIPYDDAVRFFRQAVDLGISFWDTANGYNAGTSEEAVGRALKGITAATPSSWRPRCTSRSTTVRAGPVCPARPSWSRSTPR